ncbi:MAG: penicillin-binding protein 2 [Gammaproteobacteria bacterium]
MSSLSPRVKKRIALKDQNQERKLLVVRAISAFVVIGIIFVLISARLGYLQIVAHNKYTTLAENNRVKLVPIAPNRGLIYDRNGELLAENLPSYSLEIIPERVDDLSATIEALSKVVNISDEDQTNFYKTLKRKRRFQGVPLRYQLSEEELANFAEQRHLFPGVEVNAGLVRNYLYPALTAHAIGYVGRINEQEMEQIDKSNYSATQHLGKVGVEKQYEDQLHGTVGYQQIEVNAAGRIVRILEYHPPQPGGDLYLSLDINLQRVAQTALGEKRGAVVAIDPRTGEILAFVSNPTFNSNLFIQGIDYHNYQELRDSPERPLYNRALVGQYPPASTVKPLIGLYALENNFITPEKTVSDPGWFQLPNSKHRYRDWRAHGTVNMSSAIEVSCNVYFYRLAQQMGIKHLSQSLMQFGYGQPTGIDMPGEGKGVVPTPEWKEGLNGEPWYAGETVVAGVGQGYTLVTPLQAAHAVATLANQGQRMRPHLGKKIIYPDQTIQEIASEVITQIPIQNEENWQFMQTAMEQVAHGSRGTATGIGRTSPYRIAGKTGTAQVYNLRGSKYNESRVAKHLRDHKLFIAYAPAEDPKIAIAVLVENDVGQTVIARTVMDYYLLGPEYVY